MSKGTVLVGSVRTDAGHVSTTRHGMQVNSYDPALGFGY